MGVLHKNPQPNMIIEIGGGQNPQKGSINLDPVHGEGQWKRIAQDVPWPIEKETVSLVRASHVMEHIPAGSDRITVFNEVHRVLRGDGVFEVIVPFMTGTWQAIADPTHVSFWVPESFRYFDKTIKPNADYGIATWRTLELETRYDWEGWWLGTPIKEEPLING